MRESPLRASPPPRVLQFQASTPGASKKNRAGAVSSPTTRRIGNAPTPFQSHTRFPSEKNLIVSESGLPPFLRQPRRRGWLSRAQARALGVDPRNRFALLLGFGHDLAGAVSVEDTEPREHRNLEHEDEATTAALLGRASLSGVQRKLFLVKDGKAYRPARRDVISTHIAKLPSGDHAGLMEIEFLTTAAVRALLPDQDIVAMEIRSCLSNQRGRPHHPPLRSNAQRCPPPL